MTKYLSLLLAFFLALSACASKPKVVVRKIQLPQPPAVPARKEIPPDPSLASSAQQLLVNSTHSSDPIIRAHAIEALQKTEGPAAAPQILPLLDDLQPVVRFAAAVATGELRLRQAHQKLQTIANDDKDQSVRLGAKFALHRLGDFEYSRDFEVTCRDPNPHIRGDTAMLLGLLGEPSATKILIVMLKDRDPIVRFQAAEALWRLNDERGLETLVGATVSGYPDDQMFAINAFAASENRDRARQNFRGALTSDYDEVSLCAARALGTCGSDEGYGVAAKGLKNPDPRQRHLAALAFGAIKRPDAQPLLSPLLNDPNEDVRLAAATAILQIDKAPTSASLTRTQ